MSKRVSGFGAVKATCSFAIAIALLLLAAPLVAQGKPDVPIAADTSASGGRALLTPTAPAAPILDRSHLSNVAPSWTIASPVASVPTTYTGSMHAVRSGSTWVNTTLMIVGGAGMLAGAVVGGKVGTYISVGGTVVGLVGFLNYVR